jgi:hypothetical protein
MGTFLLILLLVPISFTLDCVIYILMLTAYLIGGIGAFFITVSLCIIMLRNNLLNELLFSLCCALYVIDLRLKLGKTKTINKFEKN